MLAGEGDRLGLPHLRAMRSRTTAVLLGLLGAALLIAALITGNSLLESSVGEVESVEGSLVEPAPILPEIEPASPTPAPPPDAGLASPNPVTRLDELASTMSGASPISLRIEAIGVEAPVSPYGINDRTGQMAVPRNTTEVAWYKYGPAPGQPGSAVLAAHVDLVDRGKGVFFDLKQLQPGDAIVVGYDDGTEMSFNVVGRVVYEKTELPVDVIFSRDGEPVLTLVTCGGGFNETAQNYDSNVVVYAVPGGTSAQGV
jgi:LPXTG-site transpeptidase (sortase) family protein